MKKILFTLLFLMAFFAGYPQMNNSGGTITVETGATLVIEGNYTSSNNGAFEIDGAVQLKGNFINNGGNIHSGSTGTLTLNGTPAQQIGGTTPTDFYCSVVVNNANGVSLSGANEVLHNALTLTNGKLTLNAYDLTMAAVGIAVTPGNYVVTNDVNGELKGVVAGSDVIFPVGTASSYNPVILNNTGGTSDTYGVVFTGAVPGNWTGTEHAVNGNWAVSEAVADGSNLSVTAQWNSTDEQLNFARTDCAVGVTTNNGTSVAWKPSGAAIANGSAWTRSGSGFNTVGKFMVGDYFFEGIDLDLDVFLAGPYSGGTMSTALNSLIQTTDPYGNGVTVSTIPANAVDWIEVQLRSGTGSTIDKEYSFFVDNNGNVLNTDGTVGTKLTGIAKGSKYVAVRHRNHLGAMTSSTIDFTAAGPFTFDFSAGASIYGTNAMRNMGAKWALWAGDADGNGIVEYARPTSDITPISSAVLNDIGNPSQYTNYPVNNVYNLADVDMNGIIEYARPTSDITPISSSVLNHPGNPSQFTNFAVSQQLP